MKLTMFAATLVVAAVSGCSHLPHTGVNNRPMGSGPDGRQLVDQCVYAVRFNEDEATVREVDYMDATYCMGVMDGILGANQLVREQGSGRTDFCLPAPLKPWLAAKVIVDYAKEHSDRLSLKEVPYATLALADAFPCN